MAESKGRRTRVNKKAATKSASVGTDGMDSTSSPDELAGWQQRALDRSLLAAKRRALNKSNGFVRAGSQLLRKTGGLDFTVQDVVDHSGLSLRSFYQTFGSKDDLILAVYEDYVATAAAWIAQAMAEHDDPVEQIKLFLVSRWSGPLTPEVTRALTLFNMTLAATRPFELARAQEPELVVLLEAIERGIASGGVRSDIGSRRLAEILLHSANTAVNATILETGNESPEDVWAFWLGGLRAQRT